MTTPQAYPQEPQWDTGYGGGYSGHNESGSRAGTSASVRYLDWYGHLERSTSVMRLTRLSTRWKGLDDLSDRSMILHMHKWRCKPPSTHRPA
jgi:hypothetical protein